MLAPDIKIDTVAGMHLRQLVLPTQQAAQEALEKLRNRTDFSRLAKQSSLKQYLHNGGYWGSYQPEKLAPQFSAVLKELPPLEFSSIIATDAGFHILQKFPCFAELLAEH